MLDEADLDEEDRAELEEIRRAIDSRARRSGQASRGSASNGRRGRATVTTEPAAVDETLEPEPEPVATRGPQPPR